MAAEKGPKKEPEYRLSDEDFGHEPPPQKGGGGLLKNRKFLTAVTLIIAVLVIYFFIGRPKQEAKLAGEQPPALTSMQPTLSVSQTPELTQQQQTLNALGDQAKQNQAQIQQLQGNMQQVQMGIAQLQTQVSNLTNAVGTLSSRPAVVQQPAPPVIKRVVKVVYRQPLPVFYLHAAVPGRAWLIDLNDQTFTVRVGDYIPGYGHILAINPVRGVVSTSSGRSIRYAPNDP